MSDDGKGDYEIGFAKPPRDTRFKPGQSGNPRGREKGSKNLATVLNKALSERVVVVENGKRRSISKLEAAVKQIVNKAAGGDPKFNSQLLALVQLLEGRAQGNATLAAPLNDAERKVIEGIHERMSRNKQGGDDE